MIEKMTFSVNSDSTKLTLHQIFHWKLLYSLSQIILSVSL